jgi:hypothetical protein
VRRCVDYLLIGDIVIRMSLAALCVIGQGRNEPKPDNRLYTSEQALRYFFTSTFAGYTAGFHALGDVFCSIVQGQAHGVDLCGLLYLVRAGWRKFGGYNDATEPRAPSRRPGATRTRWRCSCAGATGPACRGPRVRGISGRHDLAAAGRTAGVWGRARAAGEPCWPGRGSRLRALLAG